MEQIVENFKALVIESPGSHPKLVEVPVPKLTESQVLIKVDSAPLNPSDLGSISDSSNSRGRPYPFTPGLEGSGTVVTPGPLQNKRVSFNSVAPHGSYAEYSVAEISNVIPIEDDVTLQQAASSFVNPGTVVGFLDEAQRAGAKAVVHTAAASQLGRMMNRYFKSSGIKIINVVRKQEQVDILKKEGAEYILNQTDPQFFEELRALTLELDAKLAFDAISGPFAGQLLAVMPPKSTVFVYGGLSGQKCSNISYNDLQLYEKQVKGYESSLTLRFLLGTWIRKSEGNLKFLQEQVSKNLTTIFKTEISSEFPLTKLSEAVQSYTSNMTSGKILLRPFI